MAGLAVSSCHPARESAAPKTLAEAKLELHVAYSASKLETEALADGWLTRFESDVAGGHQHWLQVRRTFGDKTYECSASVPQAAQLATIIDACKSLKR
jgi:hypothetical protein